MGSRVTEGWEASSSPMSRLAYSSVSGSAMPGRNSLARWLLSTVGARAPYRPRTCARSCQTVTIWIPCDAQVAASPSSSGKRSNVRRLVQHDEQGRVERSTRSRRAGEGVRQHRLGQRREVPAQPALIVGGRAEVQGVGPAQQMARLERAGRRPPGRRMGEGGEHRLGRGVDGAARALVTAPGRLGGMQGPRAARPARGWPPPRPTSCVSTQRTTSAMVRPSSAAAAKRGARSLAAVAYQNSPSAVVPSLFAASHNSAAARQASRHWPQPVSGDQILARAPVQPVGSMHHTWPWRARVPRV